MNVNKVASLALAYGGGTGMPTMDDIQRIPRAKTGEYELSEREAKRLRSRIYSLNKNNAAGRRWRTLRDGPLLLVWRIK